MLPLSALPAWSQQAIMLPDGHMDPERYNDCGEVCVASIITGIHGTPINPASVRAFLHGPDGSGITDGAELVAALAHWSVAAEVAAPLSEELEGFLHHSTMRAYPTIVLGLWPTPGKALHWMLTTGTIGEWQYINPWTGAHSWLRWTDASQLYAGQLVIVRSNLHYDASKWPMPT